MTRKKCSSNLLVVSTKCTNNASSRGVSNGKWKVRQCSVLTVTQRYSSMRLKSIFRQKIVKKYKRPNYSIWSNRIQISGRVRVVPLLRYPRAQLTWIRKTTKDSNLHTRLLFTWLNIECAAIPATKTSVLSAAWLPTISEKPVTNFNPTKMLRSADFAIQTWRVRRAWLGLLMCAQKESARLWWT